MRAKGKIASWNDDKGYGFISPLAGGDRLFVHIKAFGNRTRRPVVGDVITYSESTDTRGRRCAKEATIAGVAKKEKRENPPGFLHHSLAFSFLLIVACAVLVSAIPLLVLLIYLIVSSLTFAAYKLDKMAAAKGSWRTPESTLHMLALLGGWPGALAAQRLLRHKSKKQSFQVVFWVTVVLNCSALAWLFSPSGSGTLRSFLGAA